MFGICPYKILNMFFVLTKSKYAIFWPGPRLGKFEPMWVMTSLYQCSICVIVFHVTCTHNHCVRHQPWRHLHAHPPWSSMRDIPPPNLCFMLNTPPLWPPLFVMTLRSIKELRATTPDLVRVTHDHYPIVTQIHTCTFAPPASSWKRGYEINEFGLMVVVGFGCTVVGFGCAMVGGGWVGLCGDRWWWFSVVNSDCYWWLLMSLARPQGTKEFSTSILGGVLNIGYNNNWCQKVGGKKLSVSGQHILSLD